MIQYIYNLIRKKRLLPLNTHYYCVACAGSSTTTIVLLAKLGPNLSEVGVMVAGQDEW